MSPHVLFVVVFTLSWKHSIKVWTMTRVFDLRIAGVWHKSRNTLLDIYVNLHDMNESCLLSRVETPYTVFFSQSSEVHQVRSRAGINPARFTPVLVHLALAKKLAKIHDAALTSVPDPEESGPSYFSGLLTYYYRQQPTTTERHKHQYFTECPVLIGCAFALICIA
ncbi:hypothetical protein J3A83DRAFT_3154553 [Scleroderma citrinum]